MEECNEEEKIVSFHPEKSCNISKVLVVLSTKKKLDFLLEHLYDKFTEDCMNPQIQVFISVVALNKRSYANHFKNSDVKIYDDKKQLFFDIGKFTRNKFNKCWIFCAEEDLQQFQRISKFYCDLNKFNKIKLPELLNTEIYDAYSDFNGDLSLYIENNEKVKSKSSICNLVDISNFSDKGRQCKSILKNFTKEEVATQFYDSSSLNYFYGDKDLLFILKKLLTKLLSSFKNFIKNSLEIRKVCSILK